ncbi:MAG TPA: pyridoxamine 5'-phosphate oxidase family protein [Candidatus Eisenbacteria bacterium]|nr:pyridoxamine 5'-phosphate oxidase family protein [Candidatus Eisenbacteria bacterium]
MPSESRISAELATFLESGLSIVVGTRNENLEPDGAVAWAARADEAGERLTLFLHHIAAREMLRNLESHPEIAINFDQPTSHRACQVKGRYVSSRRARPAERETVLRQIEGFTKNLEAIGFPAAMTGSWITWPCTAIELRVTQLFEQTPGPGTGGPLR